MAARSSSSTIAIVAPRPGARVDYFVELPPPVIRIPRERYIVEADRASREDIYAALDRAAGRSHRAALLARRGALQSRVCASACRGVDLDTITFEFGSWEIAPDQIDRSP